MHLDEERLQRLVHGELELGDERSARQHVAGCEVCRAQVDMAEGEQTELTRLLRDLDQPAPRMEPGDIVRRARSGGHGWARRAAVVLASLGLAGVAYAMPGSPIPRWIRAIAGAPVHEVEPRPGGRPDSLQSGEPIASGIAVDPGARLVIVFPAPPAGARALVSLRDTSDVVVRVLAGHASFSSSADRLVVETTDSPASFQLVIPRNAPSVEIRAAGRSVFRKQGARIAPAGGAGSDGRYVIELKP
jgi:hypothetical protein